jgi:hypothetical protein
MSYLQGIISYVPQPRIPFFWVASSGVHKQPVLFEVLAPAFFILQGSHVQRQYRKLTSLHSKSSTLKGLLDAPEPHNHEKGMLIDQLQLTRVSSTALLCCWGHSRSKIWRPSWLTLRRMPYGRGTLKILLQRIFVARKARTIALSEVRGSCHKTSNNQPFHEFRYPFGDSIPGLYCIAWLGKCQSKNFCEKERYESCSVQWTFAAETFGKRRKRKCSPVVRLLPGSHKRLDSRNTRVLVQKHGGACTMY